VRSSWAGHTWHTLSYCKVREIVTDSIRCIYSNRIRVDEEVVLRSRRHTGETARLVRYLAGLPEDVGP